MSVSGVRGTVGDSLTLHLFSTLAYLQTRAAGGGAVLIGRDTRPSGPDLLRAACRGIHLAGGEAVDAGIAPTPTTCFGTQWCGCCCGIIITASHNPLPYNGYKMVHGSGRLYSGAECRAVYDALSEGGLPTAEQFEQARGEPLRRENVIQPHLDAILGAVDVDRIRSARIKVGVDSINGAAGVAFPQLLQALGVEWRGVHNDLTGNFVHNPEPRPEHLTDLAALLAEDSSLWGGFAFDPDADRLATMAEGGSAVSEEMTLAMAMDNVLSRQKTDVATNLSTSMVIDDVARAYGVNVVRTPIGEANVVEAIRANNLAFAGEGNGGVIYPSVSTVRDGLVAMALILERMASVGERLGSLAGRWTEYPIVKEKIPLGEEPPASVLARLAEIFAGEHLDRQDGLKIIRPEGWVHLRPSNTEPILRCYAEARTGKLARELARMVMDTV